MQKLVGQLWSKYFSCISLAECSNERLEFLLERIDSTETELKSMIQSDETIMDKSEEKKKHIESLVGSKDIEIEVLNPHKSSNKGSGSGKRKKSVKELAIEKSKKNLRLCRACGEYSAHDSRNCPSKKEKLGMYYFRFL